MKDRINTVTMRENRFILRIWVMMLSAFLVSCSCLMKLSPAGATVRQDQQVCSQAFRPCNGGCVRVAQREFHFGAKRKKGDRETERDRERDRERETETERERKRETIRLRMVILPYDSSNEMPTCDLH